MLQSQAPAEILEDAQEDIELQLATVMPLQTTLQLAWMLLVMLLVMQLALVLLLLLQLALVMVRTFVEPSWLWQEPGCCAGSRCWPLPAPQEKVRPQLSQRLVQSEIETLK